MKRGPGAQQKNEGTAKYYKAPHLQLSPRMNCKWQKAVLWGQRTKWAKYWLHISYQGLLSCQRCQAPLILLIIVAGKPHRKLLSCAQPSTAWSTVKPSLVTHFLFLVCVQHNIEEVVRRKRLFFLQHKLKNEKTNKQASKQTKNGWRRAEND